MAFGNLASGQVTDFTSGLTSEQLGGLGFRASVRGGWRFVCLVRWLRNRVAQWLSAFRLGCGCFVALLRGVASYQV